MSAEIATSRPRTRSKLRWSFSGFSDPQLVIHGFDMTERVSAPFTIRARLSVKRDDLGKVDADKIIGREATIEAEFPSKRQHHFDDGTEAEISQRMFTGIVTRFGETDESADHVFFQVELSPWIWLLSRTSDCRVFQNMTVLEIVSQIFDELASTNESVSYRIRDNDQARELPKRDICVQYNETALNFVSRLLEEEGIHYYFDHFVHLHTLVLATHLPNIKKCLGQKLAKFPIDKPNNGDRIFSWHKTQELTPGSYALGAHHSQMTNTELVRTSYGTTPTPISAGLEVFEYPGGYAKPFNDLDQRLDNVIPLGDVFSRARMEEEESHRVTIEGTSDCLGFTTGCRFKRKTPDGLMDLVEYRLVEVHHHASQSSNRTTSHFHDFDYHNRFECVPTHVPYRPSRSTSRPVIHSVQTARVVGPAEPTGGDQEEDIFVDALGRIRVQFHWDRRGFDDDGATSGWIRVGQGWASGGFGMHFWPRVGDEVIVAFVDGDPDCPLVVGSVYNNANQPPYTLPDERTKSGIKTRSSKNGDPDSFNEIRFEDRKDKEQIYIHAERNLKTTVESCETRSVGVNRTTTIGKHDKLTVRKGNRTADVEEGNDLLSVLKGNRVTTVDEGDDFLVVPQGTRRVEADRYELEAATSINLTVGASSILMEPGRMILAVAGTTLTLDPASIKVFATILQSTALGPHQIKGLPVAINS